MESQVLHWSVIALYQDHKQRLNKFHWITSCSSCNPVVVHGHEVVGDDQCLTLRAILVNTQARYPFLSRMRLAYLRTGCPCLDLKCIIESIPWSGVHVLHGASHCAPLEDTTSIKARRKTRACWSRGMMRVSDNYDSAFNQDGVDRICHFLSNFLLGRTESKIPTRRSKRWHRYIFLYETTNTIGNCWSITVMLRVRGLTSRLLYGRWWEPKIHIRWQKETSKYSNDNRKRPASRNTNFSSRHQC